MTSTNSNSSLSKRRQTSHEPAPVTFCDEKSPSARLNRAIQSSNLHLVKRLLETHSSNAKNKKNHVYLDPRSQDPVTRKTSLILATETSNFEICKLLIQDYHVDAESISRDLENNTVLHLAAAEGLDDIVTLYHSHYPFVLDWANSEGMTALHIASQKGNESTVSLLLDFQADVELTDNEGNTSLHYAAAWGHLKIVLLLIDRGSPFWAKNNQTFTASDYAFSFAIQSALQESARAHFESKKQQRHQRVQREERKHQRNVVGGSSIAGSDSSINLTRPPATNRGVVKSPQQQQASACSNTPQLMANTLIPKISTSPITLMASTPTSTSSASSHSHPLVPLAPTSSSSSTSKPLASPTNSIATARTVSHLISKDLEAIQGFRTKTAPGSSASNHNANHLHSQSISVQPSSAAASDPPPPNNSRLLPLQLLGGVGSKAPTTTTTAIHELRSCNSTGNLAKQIQPNPSSNNSLVEGSRNRAGSTESSDNPSLHSGLGFREGLSRLKYLKNSSSAFLLSSTPTPSSPSSANRPPPSASSISLPSPVSQNLPATSSNVHTS